MGQKPSLYLKKDDKVATFELEKKFSLISQSQNNIRLVVNRDEVAKEEVKSKK